MTRLAWLMFACVVACGIGAFVASAEAEASGACFEASVYRHYRSMLTGLPVKSARAKLPAAKQSKVGKFERSVRAFLKTSDTKDCKAAKTAYAEVGRQQLALYTGKDRLPYSCGSGGCNCYGNSDCAKLVNSGSCDGNPLTCDENNPSSCHCD